MIIRLLCKLYILIVPLYVSADLEFNVIFPFSHSQGIKVYHGGSIVQTENYDNKICFFIKNSIQEKRIFLVIVNPTHLEYNLKKDATGLSQNTIQSRTITQGKDYKLYIMDFFDHTWHVQQVELHENRIVPDSAIVFFYNPAYISHIDVQNTVNIHIKNDVVQMVDGIEKLWHEEIKYLLETLHTDLLYRQPQIKINHYKICKQIMG